MQTHALYLPMLIPLWGIFAGIALVVIGFVDKRASLTYSGWSTLILCGLISLYCNLFYIDGLALQEQSPLKESAGLLVSTGWLSVSGAFLAAVSLLFFYFKKRRYLLLATLTILFFSVLFFQYYSLIQRPK